jgi:hypothetical protein
MGYKKSKCQHQVGKLQWACVADLDLSLYFTLRQATIRENLD